MLIAEDLLLLLLDPDSGRPIPEAAAVMVPALGGAVFAELALRGSVRLPEYSRRLGEGTVEAVAAAGPDGRPQRVEVVAAAEPTDPVLADSLAVFSALRKRAATQVRHVGADLLQRLAERQVAAGRLGSVEVRVGAIFREQIHPLADSSYREAMLDHMAALLRAERVPDIRSQAVLGILMGVGAIAAVPSGMSDRDADLRAAELAGADPILRKVVLVVQEAATNPNLEALSADFYVPGILNQPLPPSAPPTA